MIKILIIIFIFFSYISYPNTYYDEADKIISANNHFRESDVFLITSLDACISCNKVKLIYFIKKLRTITHSEKINLIIESKNEKDSYYLKKSFDNVVFYEDNSVFLTEKAHCPFLLITNFNGEKTIYKIYNLSLTFKNNFFKYLQNDSTKIITNFSIEERQDQYLSRVEIINDNNILKIFDYDNQVLNTYNKRGLISQTLSFHNPLLFYRGDINYKNKFEQEGISFNNTIIKVNYFRDTIYILFDRCLYNIKLNIDSTYAIDLRSFICKYYNGKLISKKLLDILAYKNYYFFNNKHYLELFVFPKLMTDSSVFLKSISLNRDDKKSKSEFSIKGFNKKTRLNISSLSDIVFMDFNRKGEMLFILRDSNFIYILKNDSTYIIEPKGIVHYNEKVNLLDWALIDDELFLTFSDKNNFYLQTYSISSRSLLREIISSQKNDKILKSYFFSISNNKIELINRWKNKRWQKEYIIIN